MTLEDTSVTDAHEEKKIIIFGSSRSHGHTRKVIDDLIVEYPLPIIDLNELEISPYDYEHRNQGDDFLPLIEKIMDYDTFIIATPVYWYQMSAQHKIFFDRFSDLLEFRKDLGRRLQGKNLFIISTFGSSYPRGFEETWQQICDYLGMNYLGSSFVYSGSEDEQFLKNNASHLRKAKAILSTKGF